MHEADVADVVVAALLDDGHAGTAHTFSGPETLTHREQVAAIAAAVGHDIRFEVVTPEQARLLYLRQGGFAAENADFLLGFEDYSGTEQHPDALGDWIPPTIEQVLGRPARTFAQWAHDHAKDFT